LPDILKIGATSCVVGVRINTPYWCHRPDRPAPVMPPIAGYGVGSPSRIIFLESFTFGIGAALTAMVGTNKGAPIRAGTTRAWKPAH